MILNLGMQHRGLKLYKVYIDDDPRLTLTFLWQCQMWLPIRLNGENGHKVLMGKACSKGLN